MMASIPARTDAGICVQLIRTPEAVTISSCWQIMTLAQGMLGPRDQVTELRKVLIVRTHGSDVLVRSSVAPSAPDEFGHLTEIARERPRDFHP